MERSLVFFYCISGIIIIYYGIKIAKDKYKWQSITFIVSVIISCIITSSFSSLSPAIWIVLVITLAYTISFLFFFLLAIIKNYLIARYIRRIITQLKYEPYFNLVENLIAEHNKHQWYVLYSPLEHSLEIGINISKKDILIGNKIVFKCLTGRRIYLIPEYLSKILDSSATLICTVQEFYNIDRHTKTLVDDYLFRIKNNQKEPWIINN